MKYKINVLEDYIQLEINPIIKTEYYIKVEANSYEEAKELAYKKYYKQFFEKFKEIGFTQLNKIGVDIKDDKGDYKSLSDILEDLSKKFNENIKNDELKGEN